MSRSLAMMTSAVMLLCAVLLLMKVREDQESAWANTKACTDATRTLAETVRHTSASDPFLRKLWASMDHCADTGH